MPLILGANSVSGGYEIDNSLRFNSGSSDYLNRTPASNGNRTTWTYSFWLKKSKFSGDYVLFSAGTSNNDTICYFQSADQSIHWFNRTSSSMNGTRITSQVFRDPSAWYHFVFVWDTTNATALDRMKIYLNGDQITSFSSTLNPSSSLNSFWNSANAHQIMSDNNPPSNLSDGYLSEVNFIDGQALTPSSFGETDEDTGIWKPKAYTGTYGTNGFYLEFKDSSALGDDTSGNGNDFTVNNLTSIDQTTDTPTNNFATFNSLNATSNFGSNTFSEGNLQTTSTSTTSFNDSTIFVSKGKWYCEFKPLANWTSIQNNYIAATNFLYSSNGDVRDDITTTVGLFDTYTNGDIIGVALDMDASPNTCEFFKNGVSQGTVTQNVSSTITQRQFRVRQGVSGMSTAVNFGNPPYSANSYTDGAGYGNFSYAVPSGYYALNTKNLAEFG